MLFFPILKVKKISNNTLWLAMRHVLIVNCESMPCSQLESLYSQEYHKAIQLPQLRLRTKIILKNKL